MTHTHTDNASIMHRHWHIFSPIMFYILMLNYKWRKHARAPHIEPTSLGAIFSLYLCCCCLRVNTTDMLVARFCWIFIIISPSLSLLCFFFVVFFTIINIEIVVVLMLVLLLLQACCFSNAREN